jgi:ADP-heptose:LPS heptosyltransferase
MRLPRRSAYAETSKYLLGVASEVAAPLLRLGAVALCGATATPPSEWRRGIILGENHIGDVLFRTPSLPHLQRLLPDCEWTYLAAPHAVEILRGNPHVTRTVAARRSATRWHVDKQTVADLRRGSFDVALCTGAKAHYLDIALAIALRIPNRVGFTHKGLSGLVNHPVPTDHPIPLAAYFRTMVAHLGGVRPDWELRPRVYASDGDVAAADEAWGELGLGARPVVACTLTAHQRGHTWPADEYVAALRLVRASSPVDVVLCGSAADRPFLESVAARADFACGVAAGGLGLRAFAMFLQRCAALLATDSGPRHIANAVGTPVVYIRDIWNPRVEAGSYCSTDIDATPDALEFVPVSRQADALRQIAPEAVAERVLSVLRQGERGECVA